MSVSAETPGQAVEPGILLLDYYEELWSVEQAVVKTERIMGSVSPNQTLKEVVQGSGYRRSHISTLPDSELAPIALDALAAHFTYAEAEQELESSKAERDEIVESIKHLSPKIIGKPMIADALEDYTDAIIWQRVPFPSSQFMSKNTPATHAEGVHLGQLPLSLDDDAGLELTPPGFRYLFGTYSVMLLDNNGNRMVKLTTES